MESSRRKLVAYKLPEELVAVIENRAVEGVTKTDVVIQALRQAFNMPEVELPTATNHFRHFLESSQEINYKVETLSKQTAQIIEVMGGLMERLRALETAAETGPENRVTRERGVLRGRVLRGACFDALQEDQWLTQKQAFIVLGGDPDQPNSQVQDLEGQGELGWHGFQKLKSRLYQSFGFEYSQQRAEHNQPCLKPNPELSRKLMALSLLEMSLNSVELF